MNQDDFEVQLARLSAGDVLVLRMTSEASLEQMSRLNKQVAYICDPMNVKCIVVPVEIEVHVVKKTNS
jgi:hypothetical protein